MKIGLDCGHGLKTAGKQTPDGIKEWTLNDKVRDKVVSILKDYDVEIINVDNNEGNVDEGLTNRRVMYVNAKVDAFVSIHHNAYTGTWNSATGVEVYTDKNNTSKDMELANAVYKNLPAYTGLKGRGIKKANFTVINQNQVPAILVEGGFMDSMTDHKVITSDKGQEGYAKAVAEGLIEFLGLKKKTTVIQTVSNDKSVSPYTVKVKSDDGFLNVRQEPNSKSKIVTTVKNGEIYTIVAENGKWGKLKSGAGYIHLGFTERTYKVSTPIHSYYPACNKKYSSLVDGLKSIGVDSSFTNRKKIAAKNGVKLYIGTAAQNNQLLDKLKAGRLLK